MSDLCPVAVSQDSTAIEDQPETANASHLLLLKQKKYCDVTFTFPNLPDRIEAHEFCLKARSIVFEQIFRMRKSGSVYGNSIEISESTTQRFQEFLEFIYSDKFEVDIAGALGLLQLAHKYKVNPLAKKCEEVLKTEIRVQQSVQVLEAARHYGRQDFMDRAGELVVKNLLDLLETGALANAEEETIVFLLKSDDLKVEEVKLFQFVLEWGRNQVGASTDDQLLKDKLKNVFSKIRYTNMTPYEFNKIVAPTGLLSAGETLSVYSYLLADETMRKDLKIKFNTNRRGAAKMEKIVDFYGDLECKHVTGSALTKQEIRFKAERVQIVKRVWSDYHPKAAAITAIKVQWPEINEGRHSEGFNLNYRISIREYRGPVNEDNFTLKFHKTLLNCEQGGIEYIPVEPPVELTTGTTYCVIAEDQSASDLFCHRDGRFLYDGYGFLETTSEETVDMDDARLTLKKVNCSSQVKNGCESPVRSWEIAVITGITVGLL